MKGNKGPTQHQTPDGSILPAPPPIDTIAARDHSEFRSIIRLAERGLRQETSVGGNETNVRTLTVTPDHVTLEHDYEDDTPGHRERFHWRHRAAKALFTAAEWAQIQDEGRLLTDPSQLRSRPQIHSRNKDSCACARASRY